MTKTNIVSFRVNVPNATPATTPITINLVPMSRCLKRLTIFTTASVDFTKCGFRLRDGEGLIVPDNGSAESLTLLAQEQNWGPLVNSPIELDFQYREIAGPPRNLFLDFYNTNAAAIIVGGFIATDMPQLTMHDLVIEMKKYQEHILPIRYDQEIVPDKNSQRPPYGVQQIKK